MRPVTATRFRTQLPARTRFFDDQVVSAIARGVRQVIICGAGYDDRGLRFRTSGVRFFEVDHPATQADKARRLGDAGARGLTLVPADFRCDNAATLLAAAGHLAGQPSLFLCEGLLVYLAQGAITGLLAALASGAAPGSTLAASLAVHADGADSVQVTAAANARRRTARAEPFRTILPAGEHLALLDAAGWVVERTADAADLDPGARPGTTLLVAARPRE